MDEWVLKKFREAYCDTKGEIVAPSIDFNTFRESLKIQRPDEVNEVTSAVKRLDVKTCSDMCRNFPQDETGRFKDTQDVQQRLLVLRPDLTEKKWRKSIVKRIEAENVATLGSDKQSTHAVSLPISKQAPTIPVQTSVSAIASSSGEDAVSEANKKLYQWIQKQFLDTAFNSVGFIGWSKFQASLIQEQPLRRADIVTAVKRLREPGHAHSLQSPNKVHRARMLARPKESNVEVDKSQVRDSISDEQPADEAMTSKGPGDVKTTTPAPAAKSKNKSKAKHIFFPEQDAEQTPPIKSVVTTIFDVLAAGVQQSVIEDRIPNISGISSEPSSSFHGVLIAQEVPQPSYPDFGLYSQLLIGKKKAAHANGTAKGIQRDIEQAPLLTGNVVAQHANDLVPQYGLLGCLAGQEPSESSAQLFLNTNVPVSTFICGVQGSGKSHTTSCILENAVIPSPHLGQLQKPVSTLVFNYGEWSSGGAGFNISEATFLAAPSTVHPGHRVKRVTVLTSPSNLAIKKLYLRYPNVRIIPFKLKAKTLDISALSTLMAVDEKSSVPLYMAKVESILRSIAAKSETGSLDYIKFKQMLKQEKFDPTQTTMLEMRLNLLESFLDLTGTAPEPEFLPGEITIMDLSDAFVSPNTACILFKLGLERFLQCASLGKLVVLDEAHKYMLNTPGSIILSNYLTKVIRLQRHLGARVVISTQEPTVSTDLIALCSVTVIHRFTSPAWYNALKKHINAMDDDHRIMQDIENLETGEALVYAPNAVLGKKDDGTLIKATGRLLKLNVRDRVTLDGGESIMAVVR